MLKTLGSDVLTVLDSDNDDDRRRDSELAEAERTIGRLALENDLLGKASRRLR